MSDRSSARDPGSARDVDSGSSTPFAAAFRGTRMAMLITDPHQPDNPIIFVNEAFGRLTGYGHDEVIGANCRFLQGAETDPATVDQIRAALAKDEGVEVEILNYRKDGAPFWNALVISPVHDESGELRYYFASQFDVSAKKQAEFELQRAKDHLEEEVAQRMQDLQTALDQKTVLLHEVDHRVKNNLQVVNSLVLLKARRITDPEARHVLNSMAERIGALSTVHRLLYPVGDVSRFDVGELVDDLTADLVSAVPAGQVAVELDVGSVAVSAAKAAPLALLFNELVGNAVKHAFPEGRKGRLAVQAAKRDGEIRIIVQDDGVGLNGATPPAESFGRTLIEMLVRQLRAEIAWEDAAPGTRAIVTVPLNAEEMQL